MRLCSLSAAEREVMGRLHLSDAVVGLRRGAARRWRKDINVEEAVTQSLILNRQQRLGRGRFLDVPCRRHRAGLIRAGVPRMPRNTHAISFATS